MPKGGRAIVRPTYMMKRKVLILSLLLAVMMLICGAACAETADPIVTSMEITPSKLTGPGKVSVTITISNSGDSDLKEPVWLYDPAAQIVADFGTDGAALLKAGESKTWTGTYDVNQRTLDNGSVVYFVKYTLFNDSGKAVEKSQPIRAKISLQTAETDIDVKRTISPTIAREGQEIVVRYDIMNTGTVDLLDVTIQEHKNIHNQKYTIPKLKPGQTAEIKYPVTMGKKDLTSTATITYKSATQSKKQTYTVEKQVIRFGEPELEAKLSSNVKGVAANGTVTLKLVLKNTGSVDYTDIRVTDAALGDVFTNQEVKAGKSLELTKEITVPETMNYQFTVTGTDATGTETSIATEAITVTAVDPADALRLEVVATPDRTEVFEQPGRVRFTIAITNNSKVDAANVKVAHGDTALYTFAKIASGETRTMTRDTALSMPGKYRFTVTATDPLESTQTFESNEMQIAFSVPTAAPATPTPVPDPTPEPTFAPATIPPITSDSIGAIPKLIQKILLPLLIIAGVLLLGSCTLLVVASISRAKAKKASEAAVDQLERAKRRDYVTPASEEEPEEEAVEETEETEDMPLTASVMDEEDSAEFELPHLKYARSAAQSAEIAAEEMASEEESFYAEETAEEPAVEEALNETPAAEETSSDYNWLEQYDVYEEEEEEPEQEEEKPARRGFFSRFKKEKKQPVVEEDYYEDEYDYEEEEAEEPEEEEEEIQPRRSRRSRSQRN